MRRACAAALLLILLAGCPPPAERVPEPIAMHQAVAIVNANTTQLTTCLKATGSVSGQFVLEDGRPQSFDLRGVVQVLPPRHMYGTLKSGLGTEELLMGSNDQRYWLYTKRDDTYRTGTYAGLADGLEAPMPLRPDMLIEALGLNPLPEMTVGAAGPVQRIVDSYQQLIFLAYTQKGQGIIHKEYWLDRHEPRLVRRILFRDGIGRVVMDSILDDYRALHPGGPMLPRRVRVQWPLQDAVLDFRIHTWKPMPDRTPSHPAFVAPHQRGQDYPHMIDLDTGAALP